MSSSVDADVRIILNAEDNASETVRDASRRINREFLDWRRENQALERSMILNNKTFFETANTISRVGNIAQKGLNIWQSYNISQMRVADAKRNVRDITRDLNQAMAEGDFEAVARLTEELADANGELARANQDAFIQTALMVPAIAGLIDPAAKAAINIRQLAHSYGLLGRNTKAVGGTTTTGPPIIAPTTTNTGGIKSIFGNIAKYGAEAAGGIGQGLGNLFATTTIADKLAGTNYTGLVADEFRALDMQGTGGFFGGLIDFMSGGKTAGNITINNNYIYGASTSDVRDHLADSAEEATVYD